MPETRICPACGHAMNFQQVEDLGLALCPNCGGVWYDAGQFDKLVREGARAADEVEKLEPPLERSLDGRPVGKCPVDQITLHPHRFDGAPDIFVSACYQCGGIFVDAQSFYKLDAREHQYPDPKAAPRDPDVSEAGATLDALKAADMYKVQFAQYRWNSLTRHMPWYYGF